MTTEDEPVAAGTDLRASGPKVRIQMASLTNLVAAAAAALSDEDATPAALEIRRTIERARAASVQQDAAPGEDAVYVDDEQDAAGEEEAEAEDNQPRAAATAIPATATGGTADKPPPPKKMSPELMAACFRAYWQVLRESERYRTAGQLGQGNWDRIWTLCNQVDPAVRDCVLNMDRLKVRMSVLKTAMRNYMRAHTDWARVPAGTRVPGVNSAYSDLVSEIVAYEWSVKGELMEEQRAKIIAARKRKSDALNTEDEPTPMPYLDAETPMPDMSVVAAMMAEEEDEQDDYSGDRTRLDESTLNAANNNNSSSSTLVMEEQQSSFAEKADTTVGTVLNASAADQSRVIVIPSSPAVPPGARAIHNEQPTPLPVVVPQFLAVKAAEQSTASPSRALVPIGGRNGLQQTTSSTPKDVTSSGTQLQNQIPPPPINSNPTSPIQNAPNTTSPAQSTAITTTTPSPPLMIKLRPIRPAPPSWTYIAPTVAYNPSPAPGKTGHKKRRKTSASPAANITAQKSQPQTSPAAPPPVVPAAADDNNDTVMTDRTNQENVDNANQSSSSSKSSPATSSPPTQQQEQREPATGVATTSASILRSPTAPTPQTTTAAPKSVEPSMSSDSSPPSPPPLILTTILKIAGSLNDAIKSRRPPNQLTRAELRQCIDFVRPMNLPADEFVRALDLIRGNADMFMVMDDGERAAFLRGSGVLPPVQSAQQPRE